MTRPVVRLQPPTKKRRVSMQRTKCKHHPVKATKRHHPTSCLLLPLPLSLPLLWRPSRCLFLSPPRPASATASLPSTLVSLSLTLSLSHTHKLTACGCVCVAVNKNRIPFECKNRNSAGCANWCGATWRCRFMRIRIHLPNSRCNHALMRACVCKFVCVSAYFRVYTYICCRLHIQT